MPSHPDRVRRQYEPEVPFPSDESDDASPDKGLLDESRIDELEEGPERLEYDSESRDVA